MGGGRSTLPPATLTVGRRPVTNCRAGCQIRSGRSLKISLPLLLGPRIVQAVASRYTKCASYLFFILHRVLKINLPRKLHGIGGPDSDKYELQYPASLQTCSLVDKERRLRRTPCLLLLSFLCVFSLELQ